jgi:hypothetical protein
MSGGRKRSNPASHSRCGLSSQCSLRAIIGLIAAYSKIRARKLLDAPEIEKKTRRGETIPSVEGLRDRAILAPRCDPSTTKLYLARWPG